MKELLLLLTFLLAVPAVFATDRPFPKWAKDIVTKSQMDLPSGNLMIGNSLGKAASFNPSGVVDVSNAGVFSLGEGTDDGEIAERVLRVTYDFAVNGGAISTIASGQTLPDNAIVTHCFYHVSTTFTSSTDAATIAINIPTDGDVQAATAISAGGNVYDSGLHECATKGDDPSDPSTFIMTTDERDISFVIAVEAVTAGKLELFLKYVVAD